ncbi:MAG: hypothetical protein HY908_25500 [Myxococcales bacterium]|nr:hypothetical protein [Myxococcales bacterium]
MSKRMAFVMVGVGIALAGCAVGPTVEDEEAVALAVQALGHQPDVCPMLLIKCPEGDRLKQLPNCNAICVPDQGFECGGDDDCGGIFCITTPCPQPVCRGHECVLPHTPPSHDSGGEPCGDNVCAAGDYCCNASCGICAPPDGFCIQMACY